MTCATRSQLERAHLIYGLSAPLSLRWLFRPPAGQQQQRKGCQGWSSTAHTAIRLKYELLPAALLRIWDPPRGLGSLRFRFLSNRFLIRGLRTSQGISAYLRGFPPTTWQSLTKRIVCTAPGERERDRYRIDSPSRSLILPGSGPSTSFALSCTCLLGGGVIASEPAPIPSVWKGINGGALSCSLGDPHSGEERAGSGGPCVSAGTVSSAICVCENEAAETVSLHLKQRMKCVTD